MLMGIRLLSPSKDLSSLTSARWGKRSDASKLSHWPPQNDLVASHLLNFVPRVEDKLDHADDTANLLTRITPRRVLRHAALSLIVDERPSNSVP